MNLPRFVLRKITGGAKPSTAARPPHAGPQAQTLLSRLQHANERHGAVAYSHALGAMFAGLPRSPLREGHRITWFDLGATGTMPDWRAAIGIASAYAERPLDLHIVRHGVGTPIAGAFDPLSTACVYVGSPLSYLDAYGLPDLALFDVSFMRILEQQPSAHELISTLVDDGVRMAGMLDRPEHRDRFRHTLLEAAGGPDRLDVRDRTVQFWEAQPFRRLRLINKS